ncbi:MAG: VWA domain-containing protein [Desulfobacula sp.]|jgi:Ca-activated chloride channel family protein
MIGLKTSNLFKTVWGISIFLTVILTGIATAAPETAKVICRVETDREIFPAGDPQNIVMKVTLDAPAAPVHISRPPVNISLVLDRSGSMSGTKLEQAKAAAIEALSRLGKNDVFSLVTYDDNARTIIPAQHPDDVNRIARTIRQIRTGGSTALFNGVSLGAAEIRKNIEKDYVHRILLLSDGIANVGPSLPEDLGRLGAALIKEKISVTTIGVGVDYNEDLMTRLSQKSDGNTYFVESGNDLSRIFASELGDVLNVVARQVKIIITLPDDVEPMTIIGREGRINGRKIELSMNQLYGAQQKYALVEVKLPKSQPGLKMKIADAEVQYENPFSKTRETVQGISYVSFTSDKSLVEKSANRGVVKEYELNLKAMAQEKAIKLSDEGKPQEAAKQLKESAGKLEALGQKYQDEELLKEAEDTAAQAEQIEEKGMSNKDRKVLRTKSYQLKNQQKSE